MSVVSMPGLSEILQNATAHAEVVKIASANSPGQVPNPDLDDDQKRWLIVGICLHSVVSPVLRQYVPSLVGTLYNKLKQSDHIDTQTYQKYMRSYKPSNHEMNYEAINRNKAIPRNNGKKDIQKYDYKVSSEVDLTKLFMITSMAQYTGFDDTCDSSALLGIIINIDSFPSIVKQIAEKVRRDVRNSWAHCNFSEWDMIKFQTAFQLMHQLIKNLKLPAQQETAFLGQLTNWLTNGIQFLKGNTIGLQLLADLKTETSSLGKYILDVVSSTDTLLKISHRDVKDMESAFDMVKASVHDLDKGHKQTKDDIDNLQLEIQNVKEKTTDIETKRDSDRKLLEDTHNVATNIESDLNATRQRLDDLGNRQENTKLEVSRNKSEIDTIKKYLSESKPKDRMFFYPPHRVPTFVGRDDDLDELENIFGNRANYQHTEVICGLGGTGKTTLSIEYAWKYLNFYPGGIFWLSAESNEALQDSLQGLAIDINTVGNESKETVHRTLRWIANIQERWLLVVDNVDMEEIRGTIKEVILGSWKTGSKGHIIITSRREEGNAEEEFGIGSDSCITLDTLSMNESVQFMLARTWRANQEHDDNLELLVAELGGLPLALEQAAAHIKMLKCTFQEYLEKFIRKRLKLLRASNPPYEIPIERQAVRTTWQLNFEYIEKQSDTEGLGAAAVRVMEILAFLYADEIPLDVLNTGSPEVTDEDLLDGLQDNLGVKQIVEILTRFSLFQWSSSSSISVHRLVQEVIRENMSDAEHKRGILQDATRLINKALDETHTINDVLASNGCGRMSLQSWNKIALHASTLKEHVIEFSKSNAKFNTMCINIETCKILQTTAIYHSLNQRQDEALACQDQMLGILAAVDTSEKDYLFLTRIKIPLLSKERVVIQACITAAFGSVTASSVSESSLKLLDANTLKDKGNEYFKMKRYNESIQFYSEAIGANDDESIDTALLSNRSLAYFRAGDYDKALLDADKCIQLDPKSWKGYCWKAYAIAKLIQLGQLSNSWESVGLASAGVAGHLNKQCLFKYKMKIEYPIIRTKLVANQRKLGNEMTSLLNMAYTTLLLQGGCYKLSYKNIITKSVQIIGIDNNVQIEFQDVLLLNRPKSSNFRIEFQIEDQIDLHFENIFFPSGSAQVYVGEGVHVSFYRCKFSNGNKGCSGFPSCDGGKGCVNEDTNVCISKNKERLDGTKRITSGITGYAGISANYGGQVIVDSCMFDRCGGGGVLCENEGSCIRVQNSTIQNMIQMGAEARNGGKVVISNCKIVDNQFHGIAIGPRGYGTISNCIIQGNKEEGIWCGQTLQIEAAEGGMTAGGSVCEIKDNLICQNGMCGISLNGGSFDIYGNRIFENWLWGILLKSRSTVHVSNNDIFENKCGGLRIGGNYSSSVILDGNTVRDHTGPGLHIEVVDEANQRFLNALDETLLSREVLNASGVPIDEVTVYSLIPIVTTRNIFKDNDKGLQHPKQVHSFVQTCCHCHTVSVKLKQCAKCKKASYCSKECQSSHWKRHRYLCSLLHSEYTIEIKLSETKTPGEFMGMPFGSLAIASPVTPKLAAEQRKGHLPDRSGKKKFIVKIQSGLEYTQYNPQKQMNMYDQTRTFEIWFRNPQIYHLVCECGVLGATQFTTKKIYCLASFKRNGQVLCIYTDNLPPLQQW